MIERAGLNADFNKEIYSYWSAHTHCGSVAFFRMLDGVRGRGNGNQTDFELTSVCLEYVSKLLEKASDEVDRVIIGAEQRGKSMKNFDPFSTVHLSPPWQGKLTMEELKNSLGK